MRPNRRGESEQPGPDELAASDDAPAMDTPVQESQQGAGEMFITHTLGDIYKMQGHDRKAFEVYSKLAAEGKSDKEIEQKLRELAGRLGEQVPAETGPVQKAPQPVEDGGVAMPELAGAGGGEGRFEERIDTIFHYLLGDSPEHAELGHSSSVTAGAQAPSGSGEFVDMLEEWLDDIRQGK